MRNAMVKIFVILGSIAAFILVGAFFAAQNRQPREAPRIAAPATRVEAPAFSLKNFDGKSVSLSDFRGTPLVINSWAAWCPFCTKELVDLAAAQKEFAGRVLILAIDRAEPLEVAKKFTDELGATNDLVFLLDPSDSFYRSIGGFSMPETIFVSGDGAIVFHKRGAMELPEIREKINQLLLRDNP